jgi:DNA-binding sugar fermentation-stimulating protein
MGLSSPKRQYNDFNSTRKGDISESAIISKLLECGYDILRPIGNNSRYDLVIEDENGQFWHIQCKTGRLKHNARIIFPTSSRHYHLHAKEGVSRFKHYHGQIEYFAVYCHDTRGVYLVPVGHTGTSSTVLRLTDTKNNQEKNVRWARDYEL